jgi:hypothetical protein
MSTEATAIEVVYPVTTEALRTELAPLAGLQGEIK